MQIFLYLELIFFNKVANKYNSQLDIRNTFTKIVLARYENDGCISPWQQSIYLDYKIWT